jgi:hypothetical protein
MKQKYKISEHSIILEKEADETIIKLEHKEHEDVLYLRSNDRLYLHFENFLHPRLTDYSDRELEQIVNQYSNKHLKIKLSDLKAIRYLEQILIELLKTEKI